MKDVSHYEKVLRDRRAELDVRLHQVEHDLDVPASADAEERATERELDETLEGLGLSGLEEIRRIDAALARIERGEFGRCTVCDEQILEERLDLVPHAPMCRNCARAGA